MATPIFKKLYGIIDGVNKHFETPTAYKPGSVRVFRNGALLEASLPDGWSELGSNRILLKEAPKPTDIMQAYYISL
jgi:hypothetical protein